MLNDLDSAQEIMRRVRGHVTGRPSVIPRGRKLRVHVHKVDGGGRAATLLINGLRSAGIVAPPGFAGCFEDKATDHLCAWWDLHAAARLDIQAKEGLTA